MQEVLLEAGRICALGLQTRRSSRKYYIIHTLLLLLSTMTSNATFDNNQTPHAESTVVGQLSMHQANRPTNM